MSDEFNIEQQIAAYAKRVATERAAVLKADRRNARIGVEVANIILRAGGSLRPTDGTLLLARIYREIMWKRDGHKRNPNG